MTKKKPLTSKPLSTAELEREAWMAGRPPDVLHTARLGSRTGVAVPEDDADAFAFLEVLEHLDDLGPLEAWRFIVGWLEDGSEDGVPVRCLKDALDSLDELLATSEGATGPWAGLRGAIVLADPVAVFGRYIVADPRKWFRRIETDIEEAEDAKKAETPEALRAVDRFVEMASKPVT